MNAVKRYIMARMQESSTWRGMVLFLSAIGINLEPDQSESIIMIAVGTAGIIGIITGDGNGENVK